MNWARLDTNLDHKKREGRDHEKNDSHFVKFCIESSIW